jgi:hypothetical protein
VRVFVSEEFVGGVGAIGVLDKGIVGLQEFG